MVLELALSVLIGLAGSIIVIAAWIFIELTILKYRCSKAVEIVILSLREGGKMKLLPWHSTKDFVKNIDAIQPRLRGFKDIVAIGSFKIRFMKHMENQLRVVISFNVTHDGGVSDAQAIIYKKPYSVLVQQLNI